MKVPRRHDRRGFVNLFWILVVVVAVGACGGGSGGSGAGRLSSATSSAPATSATSGPAWPAPTDAALPSSTGELLQSQLTDYLSTHKLVGLSAAVVTTSGGWSGAAGVDGAGTPIKANSVMGIESVTKTFTAAEILLLSREGKVKLDAPVTDYVRLPFDTGGATIRQLATMKSGFPAFPEAALRAKVTAGLSTVWTAQEVVALADPKVRTGTLGGPAAYNGLPYYVLGMVIEKVTGRSLATAIRGDLLEPAGLDRIWMQVAEKPAGPSALPVDDTQQPIVDAASGYLPSAAAASTGLGGAGMAADAPSLARWGYLLYGGHVIDKGLVTLMTTPDPLGGEFNYGFGTMIMLDNGEPLWGHAGNWNQYTSIVLVWPRSATAVSVLVPVTGGPENDSRADLAFSLYQTVRAHA